MPEVLPLTGMADAEPDLSTFENKTGLAEDMKFLASMPELCDVTFLVGETREPVCAVKAVLAARSRVFQKMLYQAPSPQRKKDPPPRENKLRLFLKRSSEPLLNLQNAAQQPAGMQHQTLIIEEFEPDVFRQLIEYIHTGCVTLQPRTLLGVMNAADYYGLEELRRSCAGFVQCCINVDTVCALLASAERYIQYKCTKSLVQKVLEFVDEHGNEVLNLGSFTLLPQHVVRLILAREELRADEFTKFQAALMWSKKYCDSNPNVPLKEVLGNFLEYIQFHKIPANVLMREIHPLGLVPYSIIMNALAYQADPASVDPGKLSPNSSRVRRARQSQGRSMSVQSSLDPYGSNTTLSSSDTQTLNSVPKIRKAKSQSFRTRRSPSEKKPSPSTTLQLQGPLLMTEKKRSPGGTSQHERSPTSISQKIPCGGLSRQGTIRSSHRRKSSISTPLNLQTGRHSPLPYQDQKSPQGRKSPILLVHQPTMRSPGFSTYLERRSPTNNIQGRKSPLGFYQDYETDRNRSPTHFDHERKSPMGNDNGRRSPIVQVSQGRRSPIHYEERRLSTVQVQGARSPIGYSQGLITSITVSPMEYRSSIIPPITVSNPSETCDIIDRTEFTNDNGKETTSVPLDISPVKDGYNSTTTSQEFKKEKPSVMREILAFVRKPSKKQSCNTPISTASSSRTGRFAAAFSRAESGSCTPLLRQSTFSSSPAASSRAAKSAVTKQMSEVGYEPKISLKFTKMSLRLRKGGSDHESKKSRDKKSSGDEISESENESSQSRTEYKVSGSGPSSRSASIVPFELENVHFEKVGESYIKHDSIITEESIDSTSPIKVVAMLDENTNQSSSKTDQSQENNQQETIVHIETSSELVELKKSLEHIINSSLGTSTSDIAGSGKETETDLIIKTPKPKITIESQTIKMTVQCPTFEIEPPSRRASFDPPRSPYLESLRSPASTTNTTDHSSRFASGDDSFELIDTDRNRDSSFEDRYSSRDTSFDISRYQSTSYEDQNSSFELIDVEMQQQKTGNSDIDQNQSYKVDLRKSSIELVDVETFQKPGPEGRKSSLETHFDYTKPYHYKKSELTSSRSAFGLPRTKKQISEPSRSRDHYSSNMKSHHSAPHRARSPLSTQTSSNFSSRDSYDSSFEPISLPRPESTSPFTDPSRQHFPMPRKSSNDNQNIFLCTDQRCASIFEPRPSRIVSPFLSDSGNEFEPPSPRRAASASPKHTFTFRIVLKKVDSSPDAICPSAERRRMNRRRDSRKKKLMDAGKSF